ncbi:Gfo/Idh/MocA family protein [Membranihabitans maritimus]|uniref:Gfo/Idh/MocA family protein n=1 Tax=Membranihabitans maritimus TaxID=2904244 RepID=UPI001F2747FB|nr:Gfo/Idh/MocA family oxidoreductase [Membranihabitans maritimus]
MERRDFIKGATALSTLTILKPETVFGSKANSAINMGFIGCGSRGTTDISSMSRHTNININALADIFADQLDKAKIKMDQLNAAKGFGEVQKSNIYRGSEAYLELLENDQVDAVLISSPCYTHPEFLEAAVKAGKHAYCEKPAAIDVAGCRRIEKLGQTAKGKVSLAIGFQVPHATPYAEMIRRVRRGDIGKVINVQLYYLASEIPIKPYDHMSYDEARIRNHFHFRELSGGTLLDQGIHMLDICNQALQTHPVKANGSGGLKGGTEFGNAWNHYQALYEYPEGINVSYHSTQLGPVFGDVCARFIGTKGMAEAHYSGGVFISGDNEWDSGIAKGKAELTEEQRAAGVFLSSLHNADENKHKSFIQSIESGNYLNEAERGAESTLTAILGRNAAEAQDTVYWDELHYSNQVIDPALDLKQFDR